MAAKKLSNMDFDLENLVKTSEEIKKLNSEIQSQNKIPIIQKNKKSESLLQNVYDKKIITSCSIQKKHLDMLEEMKRNNVWFNKSKALQSQIESAYEEFLKTKN